MGPVELERVVYEYIDENGNKQYMYLLDEYLKLETIGFMSDEIKIRQKVVNYISEGYTQRVNFYIPDTIKYFKTRNYFLS